jgi:hypothetical protein
VLIGGSFLAKENPLKPNEDFQTEKFLPCQKVGQKEKSEKFPNPIDLGYLVLVETFLDGLSFPRQLIASAM